VYVRQPLRQRAYHRKHQLHDRYDDDQGGVSDLTAWVDDLCAAIPYPDLKYTIQFIQKHGPPLGLHLSLPKCKFLTSTNSQSPYQFLPSEHQQTLQWIRTTFGEDSEVTDGLRILGAPFSDIASTHAQTISLQLMQDHNLVNLPSAHLSLETYNKSHPIS